jgi:hypothetical protein
MSDDKIQDLREALALTVDGPGNEPIYGKDAALLLAALDLAQYIADSDYVDLCDGCRGGRCKTCPIHLYSDAREKMTDD